MCSALRNVYIILVLIAHKEGKKKNKWLKKHEGGSKKARWGGEKSKGGVAKKQMEDEKIRLPFGIEKNIKKYK